MSNLYAQFKTDANVEKTGIYLDYGLNSKGKSMQFLVARSGGANTAYAKAMEVKTKPYRRQIQNESIDITVLERILREVVAETVVISWENIEDEEGNDLPFTVKNCIKLFEDLPELYADIVAQAGKVALFRAELREEDSKN